MSLLTTTEVATMFGVTNKTVLRWVKIGYFNPIRNPGRGHFRFPADEVERVAIYVQRMAS